MEQLDIIEFDSKKKLYDYMNIKLIGLISSQRDVIANLSNISALINMLLKDINWVGFYLNKNDELILGPFQGKIACTNIEIGRGVCGKAALSKETILVHDVHLFEGHIACDSASNSEIVVPIIQEEKVVGVLDIDSPIVGRFDKEDKIGLEKIVNTLNKYVNISEIG